MPSVKALFRDVAVYGAGDVLLKATALLTLPVYTRAFDAETYGAWSFVVTLTGLLGPVLILGGDSAYARYYFQASSARDRQVLTSTWFAFLAGWTAVSVALILPIAPQLSRWSFGTSRYSVLFIVSFASIPLTVLNSLCGQVLRNQFRAKAAATFNLGTAVGSASIGVAAVLVLDAGIIGAAAAILAANAVVLPLRLWSIRSHLIPVFSPAVLRRSLAYGVPLVPASIAYWIFASSDRVVLAKLASLEDVGLYSVAASLVAALALVHGAFGQAWTPVAMRAYEQDATSAGPFYARVLTYLVVGTAAIAVVVSTFSRELVSIIASRDFVDAAPAVGPLALGFVAYSSTHVTALGISLTEQTRYLALYAWVAAMMNVAANLALVPRWGMMAAAWTTTASYGTLSLLYLRRSQRLWPIPYEVRRAMVTAALAVVFVVAGLLIRLPPGLAGSALKGVLCVTFGGALVATGAIDRRELALVTRSFRDLRRRSQGVSP